MREYRRAANFLLITSGTPVSSRPFDRRHFLASMAGGMAGIAVTSCAPSLHAAGAPALASHTGTASGKWDDTWTQRLGRHRVVFDVSEIDATSAGDVVTDVMDAYHDVLGTTDADLGFVLVLRHRAVPFFFSDALWAKYEIGKGLKEKDERTKEPFRVNPARETVAGLQRRGVTVLGCNRAVSGFITRAAQQSKATADDVGREVLAGIMPGVILLPNGLYALARAQDVGCAFMR